MQVVLSAMYLYQGCGVERLLNLGSRSGRKF